MMLKGISRKTMMTASFYGEEFDGRKTANGEIFDMHGNSAAHKTLPFGTVLKVTYPPTGKSVTVIVNDRGPFIPGRDLDLSYGAAKEIGLIGDGVGKVEVIVVKWGSIEPTKKIEDKHE
jgi:rare lipoprotein A